MFEIKTKTTKITKALNSPQGHAGGRQEARTPPSCFFCGVLKLLFRNQNLHMNIFFCFHLYTVRMYPSSVNTLCVSGLYPAIEIIVGWVELEVTFCSDSTQVTSTAYYKMAFERTTGRSVNM